VQGATCRASPRPASRAHFCSGRLHPTVRPAFPIHPSVRPSGAGHLHLLLSLPSSPVSRPEQLQQVGLVFARPYVLAALSNFSPIRWLLPVPCSKRGTVAGLTTVHRNCPVGAALVQIKAQTKLCAMLPKFTVYLSVLCTSNVKTYYVKVRVEATSG
jgi:hypothetical protein